ncbi:hypothetical protein GCM10010413_30260 [Promicromonospora sukumoe]
MRMGAADSRFLRDPELLEQASRGLRDGRAMVERLIRQAITQGHIAPDRDPDIETDLVIALTGFTPLLELEVIDPRAALAAINQHLDRLFTAAPSSRPETGSHGGVRAAGV